MTTEQDKADREALRLREFLDSQESRDELLLQSLKQAVRVFQSCIEEDRLRYHDSDVDRMFAACDLVREAVWASYENDLHPLATDLMNGLEPERRPDSITDILDTYNF